MKKRFDKLKEIVHQQISSRRLLKNHLVALYLFGSFARGTERESSDIDIAFLFEEAFYKEDPFLALQEAELFSYDISRLSGRSAEPVILNNASLNFVYTILREALCLYERDRSERIKYEVLIDDKYQDFAPFIRGLRDAKEHYVREKG